MRMSMILWIALVGLILYQSASAELISGPFCSELPLKNTDWSSDAVIPLFDPSLGVLTEVELVVETCAEQSFKFEQGSPMPADVVVHSTASSETTLPDGSSSLIELEKDTYEEVGPWDGVLDWDGPSGFSFFISDCKQDPRTYNTSNDLEYYIAKSPGEMKNLPVVVEGSAKVESSGTYYTQVNTRVMVKVCVTYYYIPCDDSNNCTIDTVENNQCVHTTITCNDSDACTTDTCDPATGCVYTPITCNDSDACTTDTCDPLTGCVFTPITCDDENACTADTCDPLTGCVFTPITCDDENACTADTCDPLTGCVFTPITCDDENACTADTCDPLTGCVFTPITCDDENACTADTCDPLTGCVFTPITCDDENACTADTCDPLTGCVFTPITCDDENACTVDTCDPLTGCVFTPITCDDENACTADTCDPLTGCVFTPITCDDENACTADTCDPLTGCVFTPITCDDDNECTTDSCDPDVGCVFTPVDCDDGDACTIDSCDPDTGCVYTPVDCDDGDVCTIDACVDGVCEHTPIGCDENDCNVMDVTAGCITPDDLVSLIKEKNGHPCGDCDSQPVFDFPDWPVGPNGFVDSSPEGQPYEYTVTCNPGELSECDSTCTGKVYIDCGCDCSAYAPDICLSMICVQKGRTMVCKDYSLPAYSAELKQKVIAAGGGCTGVCSEFSVVLPANIKWDTPGVYDYSIICRDASGECTSTAVGELTVEYNCGCGPCGC